MLGPVYAAYTRTFGETSFTVQRSAPHPHLIPETYTLEEGVDMLEKAHNYEISTVAQAAYWRRFNTEVREGSSEHDRLLRYANGVRRYVSYHVKRATSITRKLRSLRIETEAAVLVVASQTAERAREFDHRSTAGELLWDSMYARQRGKKLGKINRRFAREIISFEAAKTQTSETNA